MTLGRLIEIADRAYSNRMIVRSYFHDPTGAYGDPIAKSIAFGIRDSYNPEKSDEEQLVAAMKSLKDVRTELARVIKAFSELL